MAFLSILIPTLQSRQDKCLSLVDSLLDQIESENAVGLVEVVTLYDKGEKSIGAKRNELVQMAKGEYICFIDDDDTISNNYIKNLLIGIEKKVDCCSLKGVITWDGSNPEIFEHSLKYKAYETTNNNVKYERFPNHLNCIKKSLVFDIKFPEINHGEDTDWATKINNAKVLTTEHYIEEIMYHYLFKTNK